MSRSNEASRLEAEVRRNQAESGVGGKQAMLEKLMAQNVIESLHHVEAQMDEDLKNLVAVEDMREIELDAMREKRRAAMISQEKKRQEWRAQGHGEYREIHGEKEFFQEVKGSERVLVHFYRSATIRCNIIDKHLRDIALKHLETKIVRIDAEKSPFLVERLNIWMMPSIVICLNGKTEHTIVGMDEFGGVDDFSTAMVEYVIGTHGGIYHDGTPPENVTSEKKQVSRFGKQEKAIRSNAANLDEDDDWWD